MILKFWVYRKYFHNPLILEHPKQLCRVIIEFVGVYIFSLSESKSSNDEFSQVQV
jgi:hypothetical protein